MSIIDKHNYIDKSIVFYTKPIYEYDMKQGGFSILKEKKAITQDQIDYIERLSKEDRVVYIGKILRDRPALNVVLNEGFKEARNFLYNENNMNDSNIISIKKDAVFVNKKLTKLDFGEYHFNLKNKFTFLALLNNIEFYLDEYNNITTKGLGKSNNEIFMLELKKIFMLIQKNNLDSAIKYLKRYRKRYLEKQLDLENYRELNMDNLFRTKKIIAGSIILSEDCDDVDEIDISYNYINYILPIIKEII